MDTQTDVNLDTLVYNKIVKDGGYFWVARGSNLARDVPIAIGMPRQFRHNQVYDAVCRLVRDGKLVRKNTTRDKLQYGSLPEPQKVGEYEVAEYTAVI